MNVFAAFDRWSAETTVTVLAALAVGVLVLTIVGALLAFSQDAEQDDEG